jgi:hypothetical protein
MGKTRLVFVAILAALLLGTAIDKNDERSCKGHLNAYVTASSRSCHGFLPW